MWCVERQSPSLGSSLSQRQNTRIVEFSAESLRKLGQVRPTYGLERPWQSPHPPFCLLTSFPSPLTPFRPALPHSRPGPALPASQGKNIMGEGLPWWSSG